jgi:hypothetical protein
MTERDKAIEDFDNTMRTYLEIAKLHDLNFMAAYDIGDREFHALRFVDQGAAIDFPAKMVLDMPEKAQDYFMNFVSSCIKEQRGIVDLQPKRKFSILWGLVSFG